MSRRCHPKMSDPIWEHFTDLGDEYKTARCNHCYRTLSYRVTISNLKRHVIQKHFDYKAKISDLPKPSESDSTLVKCTVSDNITSGSESECFEMETDSKDVEHGLFSVEIPTSNIDIIWNYFILDNDENDDKVAKCIMCSRNVCCRPVIRLKTHLKRTHPEAYERYLVLEKARTSAQDIVQLDQCYSDKSYNSNCKSSVLTELHSTQATLNAPENIVSENPHQDIFQYFTQINGDSKFVQCKDCIKIFKCDKTLTNLVNHLKFEHFHSYLKIQSSCESQNQVETREPNADPLLLIVQPEHKHPAPKTCKKILAPKPKYTNYNKQIHAMLMKFIVNTYQPLSIVEQQDFIKLLHKLNPKYVLPKQKFLSKEMIPNLYINCLKEQKQIIHQEAVTICLSISCFKYKITTCISITAHFVNNDFEFKSVLLKCSKVKGACTSHYIGEILQNTCIEWDILDKINFCVIDENKSLVEAVSHIGWKYCSCFAHKLNTLLQNTLSMLDLTTQKVKKISKYYSSSEGEKSKFLDYQTKVQGLRQPLGLIDSVPTQWTSTYLMIRRFIHLEDAIRARMADDCVDLPKLTRQEWSILRQVSQVLKPFNEAMKELGAEQYVCASKALAIVSGLKDIITDLKQNEDYYDSMAILDSIGNQLNIEYQNHENEESLVLCIILDPRYKILMFTDNDAAEQAKSRLVNKVFDLIAADIVFNSEADKPDRNKPEGGALNLWKRQSLVLAKQKADPSQKRRQAYQEVESYLQDDFEPNDCNPCEWWQSSGQYKYPHLSELFKSNCNIVATVRKEKHILPKRRISYSRKNTEQILFLNSNWNVL